MFLNELFEDNEGYCKWESSLYKSSSKRKELNSIIHMNHFPNLRFRHGAESFPTDASPFLGTPEVIECYDWFMNSKKSGFDRKVGEAQEKVRRSKRESFNDLVRF